MKHPNYGPYHRKADIQSFFHVSDRALGYFDSVIEAHQSSLTRPVQHLFLRIFYQGKTTSNAISILNSWAFNLQALALLRIRLEQLIVCSFLIHEKEEVGINPFVLYTPIQDQRNITAAMENSDLANQLKGLVDLEKTLAEAEEVQSELTPDFNLDEGRFQRSWTNLDLRSMAKRRDSLAVKKGSLHSHPLEREYVSIYKTTSSIVHSDCSSLSYRFLNVYSGSERPVLMPVPTWALIVAATTSHYDLIQCFEIHSWLGLDGVDEYERMHTEWKEIRDRGLRRLVSY